MLSINLKAFPDKGVVDIPMIGTGLNRTKVEEITKSWTQGQFELLKNRGYSRFLTESKQPKEDLKTEKPPKEEPTIPTPPKK